MLSRGPALVRGGQAGCVQPSACQWQSAKSFGRRLLLTSANCAPRTCWFDGPYSTDFPFAGRRRWYSEDRVDGAIARSRFERSLVNSSSPSFAPLVSLTCLHRSDRDFPLLPTTPNGPLACARAPTWSKKMLSGRLKSRGPLSDRYTPYSTLRESDVGRMTYLLAFPLTPLCCAGVGSSFRT